MRTRRRLLPLLLLLLAVAAAVLLRPQTPLPPPDRPVAALRGKVDHILIEKAARRMTVYRGAAALKTYRIALGFAPAGDKLRQGDGRTPEGHFRITRRNGQSAYHLSLGLDYPQPEDLARARAGGYSPGGDIFIHGQPNQMNGLPTLRHDWTAGCIALADAEIEELWSVTATGTTVEIRP